MPNTDNPDYIIKGMITGRQFSLPNVRCKVFLSEVFGDIGYAVFILPSDCDFQALKPPFEFSFSGNQMMVGGKDIAKTITLNKLYRECSGTENWGTEVAETYVRATIHEMTLETHLPKSVVAVENFKGSFLLSSNSLLEPFQWLVPSYTGEVIMEKPTECFSVVLADGMNVSFNTYYEHKEGDKGETILAPYFIAEFEVPDVDGSYSPSYQEIDDFMLISSFVTRQRSMCIGWKIETASSFKEHYRLVSLSESPESYSRIDALIFEHSKAVSFLTKAYGIFNSSAYPTLLREAVAGVLSKESYLLSEFLTLYSSLETLVLIFRKEHHLEFVVDNCDTLYKKVRKTIKDELSGDDNKDKRNLLYQNIKGLNRVSFSEAFAKFKEHYNLNLDDLWYVTGKKGSLSNIRDRLVHGNKFDENEFAAVMDAAYHLRLLLERCLLVYFGCDCNEAIRTTSLHDDKVRDRCKKSFQKLEVSKGLES